MFSMHVSELTADKLMDRRQYLALRFDWFVVHSKTNLSSLSPFEDQSDLLQAGWSLNRIPVGTRTSLPIQFDPGAHPASYTMGTGLFPGLKRPERAINHPPPFSAEVKEIVDLYLYSSSVPSWQVIGEHYL
jgi:hypothetical protein